ncbi:hypothetical protein GE061_006478 [Apolygus lucorum]|uniref:Uncharacterized protein n=1 Tax=Apolygus lucorum TaxID=248454 RepID=A0A8S9WU30_APOLU|nr:hypothetical protein GE061_006478 [Apolygus lucorum]
MIVWTIGKPGANGLKQRFKYIRPICDGYTYTKFDKVNPRNKPGTAVEVALSDPFITEDRPHLLRRHDADITRIYSDLLASAPHIVAIFTGRQNSWVEAEANRVRREANETEQPSVEWKTTGAMVSASSLKLTVDTKTYDLTATDLTDVKIDDRKNYSRIIATYSKSEGANKVKITIRLKFNYDKTSWYIGDSEVDVDATKYQISPKTKTPTSLGQSLSQEDFTLEDTEHKLTLLFKSFQAEKFQKGQSRFSTASTDGRVFFTGAIWMGLLVTKNHYRECQRIKLVMFPYALARRR